MRNGLEFEKKYDSIAKNIHIHIYYSIQIINFAENITCMTHIIGPTFMIVFPLICHSNFASFSQGANHDNSAAKNSNSHAIYILPSCFYFQIAFDNSYLSKSFQSVSVLFCDDFCARENGQRWMGSLEKIWCSDLTRLTFGEKTIKYEEIIVKRWRIIVLKTKYYSSGGMVKIRLETPTLTCKHSIFGAFDGPIRLTKCTQHTAGHPLAAVQFDTAFIMAVQDSAPRLLSHEFYNGFALQRMYAIASTDKIRPLKQFIYILIHE